MGGWRGDDEGLKLEIVWICNSRECNEEWWRTQEINGGDEEIERDVSRSKQYDYEIKKSKI